MTERIETCPAMAVDIFVGGDAAEARRLCAAFCERGLCVTVTKTTFIYTGGRETGVRVGLVNYPRFPTTPEALWETAEALARHLRTGLFQDSVLIQGLGKAVWISRRPA